MRSARFGFREELEKKAAPRASRMPPHLESLDPEFIYAIEEISPDDDALLEKMGCVLYGRGK